MGAHVVLQNRLCTPLNKINFSELCISMMKEEVDDYVLEERLGQGTSGQVFKGLINSYVNIHTKFDSFLEGMYS